MGGIPNLERNYQHLIGDFIEDQYTTERLAKPEDLALLQDKEWLAQTAVVENIVRKGEQWMIYLVYANPENPHTFIRRPMKSYRTEKIAEIVGSYTRRTMTKAPKDSDVDLSDFGICWN